jgi:hypothetical protein
MESEIWKLPVFPVNMVEFHTFSPQWCPAGLWVLRVNQHCILAWRLVGAGPLFTPSPPQLFFLTQLRGELLVLLKILPLLFWSCICVLGEGESSEYSFLWNLSFTSGYLNIPEFRLLHPSKGSLPEIVTSLQVSWRFLGYSSLYDSYFTRLKQGTWSQRARVSLVSCGDGSFASI